MVSEKKSTASRKNMLRLNELGLNKHIGVNNPRWNNGNRQTGNFPCSQCGKDRICQKRYSMRPCRACYNLNRRGTRMGEQNPMWKGGISTISARLRASWEYKAWRKAVFDRDNYTCQVCGKRGGLLNADHIKQFALFPELRFEVSNGRTLCFPCHKQTETYGWKGYFNTIN